jgi:hypothetical protein
MPTFYPADLEIEVDEFLDDCDINEIEEVIQWLKDADYLKQGVKTPLEQQSSRDAEFDRALMNLVGKRFKMTKEQEELIINISKQII